jgi:Cu2+-exporting ATPase
MFLDKTGTLTLGRLSVVRWVGDESIKPLVAAIEGASSHPAARAIVRDIGTSASAELCVERAEQTTGAGIAGVVEGRRVIVGTSTFVGSACEVETPWRDTSEEMASEGLTPVMIAIDGHVCAMLGLGDQLRPDARAAVARLQRMGWRLAILSGDDPRVVRRVAETLGLDDARGGLSPEDKLTVVAAANRDEGEVVFIGDGVNDAAALAAAGVGIAVHGGAEASLAAADVYLHRVGEGGGGLMMVVELLEGSRRAMTVIRRNLGASFVYNILAVAGTLVGLVTPILAALIMPLSSITVLALSYRARTFDRDPQKGGRT